MSSRFGSMVYVVVLWSSIMVSLFPQSNSRPSSSSPYLSTTTILNYNKMVQNFKIFIYKPNNPQFKFETLVESLFYSSLQNSPYITQNPDEAHLFFVPPFSPNLPTRSLARLISRLPYWNRTLGADHFFLSCNGIPRYFSERNLVELKKNAIQISCFPTQNYKFIIPHKDLTLPPLPKPHAPPNCTASAIFNDLESESKYCLFEYGNDVSCIGEAMRSGCVPVVVVTEGRSINDMPFMDVMRWGEMAVFVKANGEGVKEEEVKRVLGGDTWREMVEYMRGLGVVASKHLMWNQPPLPLDAFNTVMYQLWLRRHTVRYVTMHEME